MGDCADGNVVDSRFGNCAHRGSGNASRGLQNGPPMRQSGRLLHLVERHIVEKYRVDAQRKRLIQLGESVYLDFDSHHVTQSPAYTLDCRRDSARGCDVVVLDQDGVVEPEAVIETPAAPDSIFLERSHARGCFACTDDTHFRAGDGVDKRARSGGYARQMTNEIQGDPFRSQYTARIAIDVRDDIAGSDCLPVHCCGL